MNLLKSRYGQKGSNTLNVLTVVRNTQENALFLRDITQVPINTLSKLIG